VCPDTSLRGLVTLVADVVLCCCYGQTIFSYSLGVFRSQIRSASQTEGFNSLTVVCK
jgi:hypothetical protein